MKRLIGVSLLIFSLFFNAFSQNKDTANVNLTNFKLFPGTFSWRGTNTYYDMTSWDSSPFTEGTLKQKSGSNWLFRMNYRLLYPGGKADKSGWDPTYKPGYPIIVFLHGGGERGNCWNGTCYCGTNNGCDVNGTPIPGTDSRFLNNDNVLVNGGQTHLNSVVLAGTKKPDNVTLDGRAFPGFLLYPQNVNAWGNDNSGSSDLSYAIRIVRLLVKQLNIDPNRIYIHGLSLGGQGVYKAMNMADWLWACALTMSGLDYQQGLEYDSVANIPLWVFQGGQDTQVTPSQSASLVKKFRQAGGIARYTVYPTLGHGTWNTAYAEPDFFTWILSHNKANIHVPFDNPNICGTTGAGVNLTLSQGFPAYQWERDGQVIAGATGYQYMANIPGVYRARFSRISGNPTEAQWNRWSDPVTISEKTPDVPVVKQTGTIVLSDLNNNKNATLTGPDGFEHYYWYKNGASTTLL
ncbi:MAG TPA: prolyl oligopeptidase family serine peptidase, partial [Cyclobacteriaceae bacterium]